MTDGGVAGIVMQIAGEESTFPHTKSGAAKAYRTAVKSGDQEMVEQTNRIFSSLGKLP